MTPEKQLKAKAVQLKPRANRSATNKAISLKPALTNKLVPLVNGPEIFAAMGKAIAKAEEFIYLTAWLLHLDVKLGSQSLRKALLVKASQGVKVKIIWCDLDIIMGKVGPEFANIEAQQAEKLSKAALSGNIKVLVSEMKDISWRAQSLRGVISKHAKRTVILGSHHQKTLVVDGKVGFCSGCDITVDVANPSKWHDVSIMIQGDGVHGLEQNFVERWNSEGGDAIEKLSLSDHARASPICSVIRTMPAWWFDSTQIRDKYLSTIEEAKQTIYMENQYLRHPEIGAALAEAAERGVKVKIILPQLPEEALTGKRKIDLSTRMGIYAQYKVLKPLSQSTNVTILSPKKRTPYIHAKLLVADKRVTLLGSANANGRSMNAKADSEINVHVTDAAFASELLSKLELSLRLWGLVKHDVDNEEVISRIDPAEKELQPLRTLRTMGDTDIAVQLGSSALTWMTGFSGIDSAKTADELRDAILEGLLDYL